MHIPIGGENAREVIIVGSGGKAYNNLFGADIIVRSLGDTATFEQHLRSHDDHRRIGAILMGGVFPAEPGGDPNEQWSHALDVLAEVEAARGDERIPVTPFSDDVVRNMAMRSRLEGMGQPVFIQGEVMLYSSKEDIAGWVASELGSSQ